MKRSTLLVRLALLSCVAALAGCAGTPSRNLEPVLLSEENFYSLLNAELMQRAQANQLIAMAECAETGRIELASESATSSEEALEALIRQLRVALARSGTNTYVLESAEWVPALDLASGTRLELKLRGLICGA